MRHPSQQSRGTLSNNNAAPTANNLGVLGFIAETTYTPSRTPRATKFLAVTDLHGAVNNDMQAVAGVQLGATAASPLSVRLLPLPTFKASTPRSTLAPRHLTATGSSLERQQSPQRSTRHDSGLLATSRTTTRPRLPITLASCPLSQSRARSRLSPSKQLPLGFQAASHRIAGRLAHHHPCGRTLRFVTSATSAWTRAQHSRLSRPPRLYR